MMNLEMLDPNLISYKISYMHSFFIMIKGNESLGIPDSITKEMSKVPQSQRRWS